MLRPAGRDALFPGVPAGRLDAQLPLPSGAVHLWFAPLDLEDTPCARLSECLAPDEIDRAARFVSERDRRRFAAGRGLLRRLLGSYLDCEPYELVFSYGVRGKPMLQQPAQAVLHFNVSHSNDRMLLGVTTAGPIGVDLESRRPLRDMNGIVERMFSERERAVFRELAVEKRADAFYRGWTCKEAFIKTSGEGLAVPLDSFDVVLAPDQPARIERVGGEHHPSRWTLYHSRPAPDCDVALCVDGIPVRLDAHAIDAGTIAEFLMR